MSTNYSTSSRPNEQLRSPFERLQRHTGVQSAAPLIISVIGVVLFPLTFGHLFEPHEGYTCAIFSATTATLSSGLVYGGYWMSGSKIPKRQYPKTALWTVGGGAFLLFVMGMMALYQISEGVALSDLTYFTAGTITTGAASGFLVGTYDARRVRAEALIQEQEKVELFNQILRHNVLNATNLIQGRAELLEPHVEPEGEPHLENLMEWSTTVSELTQKVRVLIEKVHNEDTVRKPVDLRSTLTQEVSKVTETYEDAHFEVEDDLSDEAYVYADNMLSDVIENILENAVDHNDKANPEIRITTTEAGDDIVTRIADNGPGISDAQKECIFGRTSTALEETGVGIGLYIVDQFVSHYGGEVEVEDNEPEGSIFTVRLRRVTEEI